MIENGRKDSIDTLGFSRQSALNLGIPIYNVTGNHDIGYSGESSRSRVDRFENSFGLVNDHLIINEHLIGVLNSINIDRSRDDSLEKDVWDKMDYLRNVSENTGMPLIIMTHIPLHKDYQPSSVGYPSMEIPFHWNALCVEQPMTLYDNDGFIKVQNMLTPNSTEYILNSLKPRFVFTGHDHEGCIFLHPNNLTVEYTLRSMMGEFGGYSALFEIKKSLNSCEENEKDKDNGNVCDNHHHFEYSYYPCSFVTTDFINVFFVLSLVSLLTIIVIVCNVSKFVKFQNAKYKNKL